MSSIITVGGKSKPVLQSRSYDGNQEDLNFCRTMWYTTVSNRWIGLLHCTTRLIMCMCTAVAKAFLEASAVLIVRHRLKLQIYEHVTAPVVANYVRTSAALVS